MVRSMMSFMELPPSFWCYAFETTANLLNMAQSKTVPYTPYEIWHGKTASYKYLRVWDSPAYVKRLVGNKLSSRSNLCRFIGYPKETAGYYFYTSSEQKIFVSRNAMFLKKDFPTDSRRDEVLLEESSEAPQQNDANHLNLQFPLMVFQSSIGQPENLDHLRDPPKGVTPVGCKWVYKRKLGADGEVTAFKAMLVAKEYTQQPGVNFEETYSPVAMAKSIRILLAIAAWYDYEIWKMDVKIAFLNSFVEEEIFMDQLEGFTSVGEEQKGYNFIKNEHDPCIYKKISGSSVAYLVLYVDDILLIENDVKMLGDIKAWLPMQFFLKDMAYSDASFQSNDDDAKSQSELGVVPSIAKPVVIFCDNNRAIAQAKKPRSHHRSKYIFRRYHLLREMVSRGDVRMDQVSSAENTADPLTKPMSQIAHTQHLDKT
ncbi:UNVERIFIED_CONTAM: Retrovirus-related Pol polyprotein from transposon RE2 [Sesamum latifolium]|uniref:Retrovirus-related Pol polyprotein from transposon RE2 n=1 Tax=Sesamum latifolium TaxID=2727402 RepID=A0AAW2TBZ8_9LAMI